MSRGGERASKQVRAEGEPSAGARQAEQVIGEERLRVVDRGRPTSTSSWCSFSSRSRGHEAAAPVVHRSRRACPLSTVNIQRHFRSQW